MDRTLTVTITLPAEHVVRSTLVELLREAAMQYEEADTPNLTTELTTVHGAEVDITLE